MVRGQGIIRVVGVLVDVVVDDDDDDATFFSDSHFFRCILS